MGNIRASKSARSIFQEAFKSTDVTRALKLIGKLIGKPIQEEEIIVLYSRKTGKPEKFVWKPYEPWDGKLWLENIGTFPQLDRNEPLFEVVTRAIPKGKVIQIGNVIVEHVPPRSEGGSGGMMDQGGTWPAHFHFKKPIRLQDKLS
ncbi:MAG: hypothetical protein Q8Q46_02840 [Candidatus Giovannonibacteria bacterium]|nr:hypothetical protein [Candidatus Giovannonibacteria bacterium]